MVLTWCLLITENLREGHSWVEETFSNLQVKSETSNNTTDTGHLKTFCVQQQKIKQEYSNSLKIASNSFMILVVWQEIRNFALSDIGPYQFHINLKFNKHLAWAHLW